MTWWVYAVAALGAGVVVAAGVVGIRDVLERGAAQHIEARVVRRGHVVAAFVVGVLMVLASVATFLFIALGLMFAGA